MDANTIELLKECNKGSKMAIASIEQLLEKIQSTDFAKLVKEYDKEHKEIEAETTKLLKECGEEESEPGVMISTFSYLSTEIKTMVHDDKKIAKLLMDGCNMGIQSVSKYLNKYTESADDSVKVARKLIKIEQHFMESVKEYL
ncbi:MAG: hypothetical protein J6L69_11330 [Lachnospiraceae bacterium]|nr:hypothetical protein [Lachnospiraceae bacterium]